MNIDTNETLGGRTVTLDQYGYFQVGDLRYQTFDGLRQSYEIQAAADIEAKRVAAARRRNKGLACEVINTWHNRDPQPATYRGVHGNTNSILLTVNGEKTNAHDGSFTVLRPLTEVERSEYRSLCNAVDATRTVMEAAYTGPAAERWQNRITQGEGSWLVSLYPDSARQRDVKVTKADGTVTREWRMVEDGSTGDNVTLVTPFAQARVEYDPATRGFVTTWVKAISEVRVNYPTSFQADTLQGIGTTIMQGLHPHQGAETMRANGETQTFDTNGYTAGILTEGFDVEGYRLLVKAHDDAKVERTAWVHARLFQVPAEDR